MPPKRRSRKKTAKAAPPPVEEDNSMQTNEPQYSSSMNPESVVEIEVKADADVPDTLKGVLVTHDQESAEDSTMTGVEETGHIVSKSGNDQEEDMEKQGEAKKVTMEERKAKFDELRKKMVRLLLMILRRPLLISNPKAASSKANRASLIEEAAKAKVTARDATRLERQRKLAEILRTKADAEERGEDVERQKNWEYTIEENDEWEKKLARKKRRADFEFHGSLSISSFVNRF
jgi:pre-mRNA-splicing factor SYF2